MSTDTHPTEPDNSLSSGAAATEDFPTLAGTLTLPVEDTAALPLDELVPDEDEEWVTQTRHGIRFAVPIAAMLAILFVAAGFWGGVTLEKNHGASGSAASLASRFRSARSGTTSTTGASGFGGFTSSSAATGTISVVDGNTLYILTSTGALVKVTLSKTTTITRNADSTAPNLRPGDTVTVQGTTASNGNVSATSIAATAAGVTSSSAGYGGYGAAAGGTSTTTTTSG